MVCAGQNSFINKWMYTVIYYCCNICGGSISLYLRTGLLKQYPFVKLLYYISYFLSFMTRLSNCSFIRDIYIYIYIYIYSHSFECNFFQLMTIQLEWYLQFWRVIVITSHCNASNLRTASKPPFVGTYTCSYERTYTSLYIYSSSTSNK